MSKTIPKQKHILAVFLVLCAISVFIETDNILTLGPVNPFREFQTAANTQIIHDEGPCLFTRLYFKKSRVSETGVAVLEFPVYQNVVAALCKLAGKGFQPFWGKLLNIIVGLYAYLCYFLLIKLLTGENRTAMLASFFLMFSAIILLYERAFMIDLMALSFSVTGLYFLLKNLDSNKTGDLLSGTVFSTLSLLIKPPFGIVIFLPYLTAILLNKRGHRLKLTAMTIIVPGIITGAWLALGMYINKQNGFVTLAGLKQNIDWYIGPLGLRFSGHWAIILKNIFYNVTTPVGFLLFIIGLFHICSKIKKYKILFAWLVSGLIYTIFFFRIQSHVYYILPVVPVIAFLMALGADRLIAKTDTVYRYKNLPVVSYVLLAAFLSYFLFYNLPRAYANTNSLSGNHKLPSPKRYLPKLGSFPEYPCRNVIDKIADKNDLVLHIWAGDWTSTNGFLTRRYGENLSFDEITKTYIDKYIEKGFKYAFVYNAFQPNEHLYLTRFKLVFNDPDKLRIYNLREYASEYKSLLRSYAGEIEETDKKTGKYFINPEQLKLEELFSANEVTVGGKTGESLANPNLYVEETGFLPAIDEGFYILRFEYKNTPDARPIVVVTPWTGEFHMKFTRHILLVSACSDEYYKYGEIFYVPEDIKIMHPRLLFRNHNQGEIHFRNIKLFKITNTRIKNKSVDKEDYVTVF